MRPGLLQRQETVVAGCGREESVGDIGDRARFLHGLQNRLQTFFVMLADLLDSAAQVGDRLAVAPSARRGPPAHASRRSSEAKYWERPVYLASEAGAMCGVMPGST